MHCSNREESAELHAMQVHLVRLRNMLALVLLDHRYICLTQLDSAALRALTAVQTAKHASTADQTAGPDDQASWHALEHSTVLQQ